MGVTNCWKFDGTRLWTKPWQGYPFTGWDMFFLNMCLRQRLGKLPAVGDGHQSPKRVFFFGFTGSSWLVGGFKHLLFYIILYMGMSSFPLTNSIIFQDAYCTTNQIRNISVTSRITLRIARQHRSSKFSKGNGGWNHCPHRMIRMTTDDHGWLT